MNLYNFWGYKAYTRGGEGECTFHNTYEHTCKKYTTCACIEGGSFMEAHLFGSMEEDEECVNDHTLTDDSNAQGGDKETCSVGEDTSDMCNEVLIEMELMQFQVDNDLHEDIELQSEL